MPIGDVDQTLFELAARPRHGLGGAPPKGLDLELVVMMVKERYGFEAPVPRRPSTTVTALAYLRQLQRPPTSAFKGRSLYPCAKYHVALVHRWLRATPKVPPPPGTTAIEEAEQDVDLAAWTRAILRDGPSRSRTSSQQRWRRAWKVRGRVRGRQRTFFTTTEHRCFHKPEFLARDQEIATALRDLDGAGHRHLRMRARTMGAASEARAHVALFGTREIDSPIPDPLRRRGGGLPAVAKVATTAPTPRTPTR